MTRTIYLKTLQSHFCFIFAWTSLLSDTPDGNKDDETYLYTLNHTKTSKHIRYNERKQQKQIRIKEQQWIQLRQHSKNLSLLWQKQQSQQCALQKV